MFRSILVPLDGSPMAHQALVPAGDIARRLGASLSLALVHPWVPAEDVPPGESKADRTTRKSEAAYLDEIRIRAGSAFHVPVETVLLEGAPAPTLAAYAAEREVDLLVSSTHGRGTLGRALRGSVALRLAHQAACPALLVKPRVADAVTPDPDGFARIMVPLDGTAAAETAIEPALALGAERGVVLFLVRVISPSEPGRDGPTERRREANRYLNAVAERFDLRGVRVECRVVARADTGGTIARLANRLEVDLLAVTTRERGEGERLLLGSVADNLVHLAPMPVLVCHGAVRRTAVEPTEAAAALPSIPARAALMPA